MGQRLGQHFLTDENVLKTIASFPEIKSTDSVIEIGSGHGELTKYLTCKKPKSLTLIEADRELAPALRKNFPEARVVEGDVLEVLADVVSSIKGDCVVVGNIPYYITGYLFRIIGDLDKKPKTAVFTVQKEVAVRICAEPPRMNLLAASVQFWAEPKLEMIIKKGLFSPPPKVDSAVLKLTIKEPLIKAEIYYPFIKALFKQPRKTILNNISAGLNKPKIEVERILVQAKISPSWRPETLKITDITSLARVFEA